MFPRHFMWYLMINLLLFFDRHKPYRSILPVAVHQGSRVSRYFVDFVSYKNSPPLMPSKCLKTDRLTVETPAHIRVCSNLTALQIFLTNLVKLGMTMHTLKSLEYKLSITLDVYMEWAMVRKPQKIPFHTQTMQVICMLIPGITIQLSVNWNTLLTAQDLTLLWQCISALDTDSKCNSWIGGNTDHAFWACTWMLILQDDGKKSMPNHKIVCFQEPDMLWCSVAAQ